MPAITTPWGLINRKMISPRIITIVFLSLIEMHVRGQNAGDKGFAYLRMNEVNSFAAKHFLTNFSEATSVSWISESDFYIARFNDGHSTGRAYYKKNGNFTCCIKHDPVEELDKQIKSAIFDKFPGCKILIVTEITNLERKGYYINIKCGEYLKTLIYNDEGIRVTGNTLWLEKRLWKDFMDYEKELNEIIRQYRTIVLCSYCLRDCEISEAIQVSNNHQFALIKNEGKWKLLKDGERKLAERRLLAYQWQLKSLASELALVDEKGKHRVAVQMRERSAQSLIASKMKLETLSKSMSSEEFRKIVDEVCHLLSATTRDLQSLSLEINSPALYELGFEEGVACLVEEQIDSKSAIKSKFEDDGQVKPLSDDVKILLFRSVKDLLSNVIKHSHAQNVKVSIRKLGNQIKVRIEDDGVGFSPSKIAQRKGKQQGSGHFSIGVRLRELGGYLEIDSKPKQGCSVTMTAPLISDS